MDIHDRLQAIDKTRIAGHEQVERKYQNDISAAWKEWDKEDAKRLDITSLPEPTDPASFRERERQIKKNESISKREMS